MSKQYAFAILVLIFCLTGCASVRKTEVCLQSESKQPYITDKSISTDVGSTENTESMKPLSDSESTVLASESEISKEPTTETTFFVTETLSKNTEQPAPADVHTHVYEKTVVAPTCKETGYTLHECACGESYKDSFTDKTDHVFGPWYVRIPPTHFAEGKESRECMYCDTYEDITLPITPHPTCEDLNIDVYEVQRQVLEYIDTLEGASADTTLVGTDRGGMAGWTLRVFTYAYKTQDRLIEVLKESVFVQYETCMQSRDTVKMHVSLEVDWFDSGHYIFTVLYF